MPVGPFDTFAQCVSSIAQDPDIDDPEAFCGYLESLEKDASVPSGAQVMYGGQVMFVSLVDNPAVMASEWMKTKGITDKQCRVKTHEFMVKSDLDMENYVVRAPALIPNQTDGNGEIVNEAEIYKLCLSYMAEQKIDSQHDFNEGKGQLVFNDILRHDETYTTLKGEARTMPKGTWMVGIRVTDPKEWDLIKSGQRRGVSIAGYWNLIPLRKSTSPGGISMDEKDLKQIEEVLAKANEAATAKLTESVKAALAEQGVNMEKQMTEHNATLVKALEPMAVLADGIKALLEKSAEPKADDKPDEEKPDEDKEDEKPEDKPEDKSADRKAKKDPPEAKEAEPVDINMHLKSYKSGQKIAITPA